MTKVPLFPLPANGDHWRAAIVPAVKSEMSVMVRHIARLIGLEAHNAGW